MTTNKTRKSLLLIMLVILLTGAGIWFVVQQRSSIPAIRHVVLISLDTCRADHLSCYGYARPTTPHIDALARQGYLFSHAMTPIPMTLPAHASMLTGTIPPHHGKHENKDVHFDPSHVTLAALLKTKGYRTGAFVGSQILNGRFGLNRGFDTYHDRFAQRGQSRPRSERRAEEVNRVAFAWLEKQKDNPVFLFLHYYDPHDTYDPPEPFATTFKESPYAGEIAYTDHCIGQVVAKLKSLDMYESSLIIITSDHGEMLGEHGEITHMYFIYQSAMKVPLIFKLPGSNGPQRIDDLASIIDIVPTVCDLVAIDPPAGIQGKNLAPCFSHTPPQSEDRELYCESLYPTKYEANSLLGLISKRWKYIQTTYIQTTRPELYDLQKDPGEQTNLVEAQPHRARILKDRLAQVLEQTVRQGEGQEDTPLDAESLNHLRSLGYVAGSSVKEDFSFDQSAEDPKDLIGFHNEFCKISHLVEQNKLEGQKILADARASAERLIQQHPGYYGLYQVLLNITVRQKDYANAIRYGEKALALKSGLFRVHHNLGLAYSKTQQHDEAVKQFELALASMPKDQTVSPYQVVEVLNSLAWALVTCPNQALRDPAKALELAQKACSLTPSQHPQYPKYLNTLAVAHVRLNNFSEAVKFSEKALALAQAQGSPEKIIINLQKQLALFKKALAESK